MSCYRPTLDRCPACPERNKPQESRKPAVAGDGPKDSRIVFVGEAPGREENNRRRPFVGKTGEEFNNTYLPLAGCSRDDIYITNSVKCHWADSSDAPPDEVVKSCTEFHLRRELEEINPETVVLMGGVANSILNLNVDLVHGIARRGNLWDWSGLIYSTFHPALGLHMPNKMQNLLDDFRTLKAFLRGEMEVMEDEFPNPAYYRLTSVTEVDDVMGVDPWTIAVDTESVKTWKGYRSTIRYTPYCATFCVEPGEAFMVKVEDGRAFAHFGYWLNKYRRIIMHNAPHDINVLGMTGIETPWDRVQDTMSLAYHDGRLAKGLKYLSYKLLGAQMRSFDDVVEPYGFALAIDFLNEAAMRKWSPAVQEPTGELDIKKCPECKGTSVLKVGRGKNIRYYDCDCDHGFVTLPRMSRKQSMNQKINRFITDYLKNPDIKVWDRWDGWAEKSPEQVNEVIATMGPIPLASIEQVPEAEQLVYACGDAHGTRRIFPILKRRLSEIRGKVR